MSIDATNPSAVRPVETPRRRLLGSIGLSLCSMTLAGHLAGEDLDELREVIMRLLAVDRPCEPTPGARLPHWRLS